MPPVALTHDPLGWLPEDWSAFLSERGERAYRALQIFRWIHARGVVDPDAMTNLGKPLRNAVSAAGLKMPATLQSFHRASDGTAKATVDLAAGGVVETVLIPPLSLDACDAPDADESDEAPSVRVVTQCISTQVGCAMGCVFCASGIAGLKRNMTAAEIVSQVLIGRGHAREGEAVRNVVYMGMGEPLHNYEHVARSLRLLTHSDGVNLSTRRVTVSTSGLVPEIERLGTDFRGQIALAVSLHAPDDALRTSIMPINKKYPLAELLAALRRYPLAPRRRITIEYTLLDRVNDSTQEAEALARVLRGIPVKINLIPMNPVGDAPFRAPEHATVLRFQDRLRAHGYTAFIRKQRGDEIAAACGQLALANAPPRKRRLPTVADASGDHG